MKLRGKRLFLFFMLELIALCLVASFRFINIESTVTLLMFNFLFASLTFQLSGSINRKLGLLTVGNMIGLFWNLVFFYFSSEGTLVFGKTFDAVYTIIYPILNLMWVVPFWSLSLGALPKMQTANSDLEVNL
jgi:hypothetical protein